MFYLTVVNKTRRHCHSWLARQRHNQSTDEDERSDQQLDLLWFKGDFYAHVITLISTKIA